MSDYEDDNRQRDIANAISPGESVIWSGRPRTGLLLRPSDAFMIPFSLFWGGFAMFWEWGVSNGNGPHEPIMMIWGIPFVAIGLYMIVGRFFVDSYVRGRTTYIITNRRAIIAGGLFWRSTTTLPLKNLTDVTLTTRSDGSGTIMFGRPLIGGWASQTGWPGTSRNAVPSFEFIADAKQVHDKLLEAQRVTA